MPEFTLIKGFLDPAQADWAWNHFLKNTNWQQDKYHFDGRTVLAPRLTALYGNKAYKYSGMTKVPNDLTEAQVRLLSKIRDERGFTFNSILLNLYRNGKDSIGFHSDDEPELGINPVISSISLGSTRIFELKSNSTGEITKLTLEHGDYLEMGESVQPNFKHGIKKCSETEGRISLTFRSLV